MKSRLILILVLVIMISIFTGCVPAPTLSELTIPEIITMIKGHNNDILDSLLVALEDSAPSDFTEGDLVTLDEGIICEVTSQYMTEVSLAMILDDWVATDGTEIGGYMTIEIEYHASSEETSLK